MIKNKTVWIVERTDNHNEFQPGMTCYSSREAAVEALEINKATNPRAKWRVMQYIRKRGDA